MARKAVNGFPEKSYYDNTRYLGIVATTDPLNEGLFKHMVNFDVSDTGQSVQPREGYLTTTLKNTIENDPGFNNHISLSNKTIIYKDNTIGQYIIFDLDSGIAYIADVSGYNIKNYYLPIVSKIANYDWDQLFQQVLIPQLSYVATYSGTTTLANTINNFKNKITPIEDTKIEHIYDENGISRALVKVTLNTGTAGQTPFNFIIQLRYRQTETSEGVADTLIVEGLPYMFQHPTLVATERNLAVSKSIIPDVLQNLYTEPVSINPGSINPRPDGHITTLGNFVYVYDSALNYVNNFIDRSEDYTIKPFFDLTPAAIQLNNEFTIIRTFTLNSTTTATGSTAEIRIGQQVLGEGIPVNTFVVGVNTSLSTITMSNAATLSGSRNLTFVLNNSKWAYKLELFNTSTDVSDKTKEVIFTSPWMSYDGVDKLPTRLFNNTRNNISLENENRNSNHYRGARYVIYVVRQRTTLKTTSKFETKANGSIVESETGKVANGGTGFSVTSTTLDALESTQDNWEIIVNTIKDLNTLRRAIVSLGTTAAFYVYDLRNTPSTGVFSSFDESMETSAIASAQRSHTINTTETEGYPNFLSSEEFLKYIEDNNVFKTNYGVVFKLLPFASFDTRTVIAASNNFTSNSKFDTVTPRYFNGTKAELDLLITALNTRIQIVKTGDTDHGKVYRQTSSTSTMNYVEVTTPTDANSTQVPTVTFKKDAFYFDERRSVYYRWDNLEGFLGQFTSIGVNPTLERKEYRWFFASVNYWNNSFFKQTYINKSNINIDNEFYFFKDINNKVSLEANISELEKFELPVVEVAFNPIFANEGRPVRISTTAPITGTTVGFTNELIQVGTQIYRQIGTSILQNGFPIPGLGNLWIVTVPSTPALPTPFSFNNIYRDTNNTTTPNTYRWFNTSGTDGTFTPYTSVPLDLKELGFFDKGVTGIFYMKPYDTSDFNTPEGTPKDFEELETLKVFWGATSFTQSFNLVYTYDTTQVTFIDKILTKEPGQIQTSNNLTVFEDSRLLVWNKNVLFISEEGKFYWFKEQSRIEFAEEIVKVLQYKTIILVFTTQHLYAVYRVETTTTQLNTATNQIEQNVTGFAWLKQIVLYNLLVNKKYADVIQIFNQMVLFYSEDGQLFMIRPSNTIDSETRFSIQFLNKAANDILDHYDEYINERLAAYGKDTRITKDQVKIKALVSINFIKIFYYVPNVITYILNYDVLNNRYYAYDTLTFTDIFDKRFIESGDLLITQTNNKLFFTLPFVEPNIKDNHVDLSFTNNFKKEGINCLIDTGNMNLNNHLHKRFRDLHVTFKNLNAGNVLFNLETMIDEVIARPFFNEVLTIQELGGASYIVSVPKFNDNELVNINEISETATDAIKYSLINNLFENNNILMDFSQYTSSKLLTHRTSILGLGKVFRLKLQFISKGLYKLQNFGIIYKERRV
jgi:hypothetical protein